MADLNELFKQLAIANSGYENPRDITVFGKHSKSSSARYRIKLPQYGFKHHEYKVKEKKSSSSSSSSKLTLDQMLSSKLHIHKKHRQKKMIEPSKLSKLEGSIIKLKRDSKRDSRRYGYYESDDSEDEDYKADKHVTFRDRDSIIEVKKEKKAKKYSTSVIKKKKDKKR